MRAETWPILPKRGKKCVSMLYYRKKGIATYNNFLITLQLLYNTYYIYNWIFLNINPDNNLYNINTETYVLNT